MAWFIPLAFIKPLPVIRRGVEMSQEQVWALNYPWKVIYVQKRTRIRDFEQKSWFSGRPGSDLLWDLYVLASFNPSMASVEVLGCLRNKFELLTIPGNRFTSRNVPEYAILSHSGTPQKKTYWLLFAISTLVPVMMSVWDFYMAKRSPLAGHWANKKWKSQKTIPRDLSDQKSFISLDRCCPPGFRPNLKWP